MGRGSGGRGMNKLLKDEIEWIRLNVDKYDSKLHAESVIGNIRKRYRIAKLETLLRVSSK